MKDVVAAIIEKDDMILIAQRSESDKLSLLWEFPGGKREEGECLEEALEREIKEELNMDIKCQNYFGEAIYDYGAKTIRLIVYNCKWVGSEMKISVHNDVKWVRKEQLKDFHFAPADKPIVNKLLENS